VEIPGEELPGSPKKSTPMLAFLVESAIRSGYDPATLQGATRWSGRIPTRGLSAWEEGALRQLLNAE